MRRFHDERDWFFAARYGLFVHWGLYAIPGWQEQQIYRLGMERAEYGALARSFDPAGFDPGEWLDLMEQAGMKYLCFTTKHIDGFCMWDTDESDFKVTRTPYGKDVLDLVAKECQRRNVPLCLYYSLADMAHPSYPNSGRPYELPGPAAGDAPDESRYLEYVRRQVEELCTRYGKIHGFWWDARNLARRPAGLNDLIRRLQPAAVINGRGLEEGDFATPEREWEAGENAAGMFERPTEVTTSVGFQSWGYRRNEDFYTDRFLAAKLDRSFAHGANFLLNVGPDAQGRITPEYRRPLLALGNWLERVGEAFEGCVPANGLIDDRKVLLTRRGNVLYVHLLAVPESDAVILRPIDRTPLSVRLLNTGKALRGEVELLPWHHLEKKAYLRIPGIPVNELANEVPVLRLEFAELPESFDSVPAAPVIA